jgi:putative ABC transport system substrate-binding protein
MRRRGLLALLGGAAASWPLAGGAQSPKKLPVIGFFGTSRPAIWTPWTAAFVKRLGELGWVEGRTVLLEYRWGEANSERFAEIAAEFARLKVDVIVTGGSTVAALKQATSTIPIVFAIARDPVGEGLVAGLARPGGNVTGLSLQITELAGKRLELLREMVPALRRLAILAHVDDPAAVLEKSEVEAAARLLGFAVVGLDVHRVQDIQPAVRSGQGMADALYVCSGPVMNSNRAGIYEMANAARLPAASGLKVHVEAGGLMSYGPDYADLFRRAAGYVDKILRGAKPADLPVEQPIKFELVINLKTAAALGLTVPPALLARADEVIE